MSSRLWQAMGVVTLIALLYMLYPFTSILVYSVFIYYIGQPVYQRILPKLKSKSLCAFVSIFLLALPIVIVVMYTIAVASVEMQNFLKTTDIPALQSSSAIIEEAGKIAGEIKLEGVYGMFTGRGDITNRILDFLYSEAGSLLWNIISSALNTVFKLFLILVISFYLLIDGHKIRLWLKSTLFPKDDAANRFFDSLDEELSSIFSGNILTAGLIAVLGALVFTVVNNTSSVISIPYPVLLGILCGLASLIPVVGVALIWAPLTIYLALNATAKGILPESITSIALFLLGTYVIVDWLPNMLLRPMVAGKKMHKGMLLLSYIFGPIVFGFKGLFLGPMILVLAANYAEIILPKLVRK